MSGEIWDTALRVVMLVVLRFVKQRHDYIRFQLHIWVNSWNQFSS